MDYKYIEQLLDRYFECQTTLEEEAILRSFFRQQDVPVSLLPYRDLFACQQEIAEAHLPADFDERVLSLVEGQEHAARARRVSFSYRFQPFLKAAAAIAILLTFTMAIQQAAPEAQPEAVAEPAVSAGSETALGEDKAADTLSATPLPEDATAPEAHN